jgi:hypothetical protein
VAQNTYRATLWSQPDALITDSHTMLRCAVLCCAVLCCAVLFRLLLTA